MTVINTEQLGKAYGGHVAVSNLNLKIERGEIFGFIGANGAGKTTTLRMLTGGLEASTGTAVVDGVSTQHRDELATRVGVVFGENIAPEPSYSAAEYLQYFAKLYGMSRQAFEERASELVELLGLESDLQRPIGTLSGGNRRKVEIIRALQHKPRVLFLDEPTRELDLPTRRAVWDAVAQKARVEGLTVFLCSHDAEEIARLCTRIAIVHRGRITWCGNPRVLATTTSDLTEALVEKLAEERQSPVGSTAHPARNL